MSLEQETKVLLAKLDEIQRTITDRKTRNKVMRKPAQIVADTARQSIPKSPRVHYRYSTPKLIQRRRAAKGSGVIVAAYHPGNLRLSIKRLLFRRSAKQFVGPKLAKAKSSKGVFGLSPTKVDGFYARFLEGSEAGFRRRFMEPALKSSAAKVLVEVEKQLDKVLQKLKNKTGL